jgi:phage baseplate assembly protein W
MKATKIYTDINLNFIPHPLTGDLTNIYDEECIITELYNLFSYRIGEFLMQPKEGSGVSELLFEPDVTTTRLAIKTRVEAFIRRKSPRITLVSCNVYSDQEDGYEIEVIYKTNNVQEEQTSTVYLKRVR